MSFPDPAYTVAQAACYVSTAMFFDNTMATSDKESWTSRPPAEARRAAYRFRHGIPDSVPDDALIHGIRDDWDND
jgi:hypothetical protein